MKKPVLFVILALAVTSLACSVSFNLPRAADIGPTETVTIQEPAPAGSEVADVYIAMGAGELDLTPGGADLVAGTIRYNVEEWQPIVTRSGADLRIEQETAENLAVSDDLVNEWVLTLSQDVPMNLEIRAGAYQGDLDLSGLRLRSLEIGDGASQSEVSFNVPNPEVMESLRYSTGASEVTLTGLANANFERMDFDSGAGNYTLDFSGELQNDASVDVQSGVSQVTIVIPEGMRVRVNVGGGLNNVDLDGDWNTSGDTYETDGEGPLLTIDVDMGLGNLRLVRE